MFRVFRRVHIYVRVGVQASAFARVYVVSCPCVLHVRPASVRHGANFGVGTEHQHHDANTCRHASRDWTAAIMYRRPIYSII